MEDMSERETLHKLIDTLPDGALVHTRTVLQDLQVWPPQPSPEALRGRIGGGGGGGRGSWSTGPEDQDREGHFSHSWSEGDAHIQETRYFKAGHELKVVGRVRFHAEGLKLVYRQQIYGS